MKIITRDWDWWAYLFRVTHREQIEGIAAWDDRLIEFTVALLELEPGMRLLDVACGSGVHLLRLAQCDIAGVGVDIAPSLVEYATARAADAGLAGRLDYRVGDMRDLGACAGDETFHAMMLLSGSFGFFDDATNQRVLREMAARLRPGGRLLLDCVAPAWAMQPRARTWSEFAGGISIRETWFDPVTCTRVSEFRFLDASGVMNLAAEPERIRVYTLPELHAMLAGAGLEFRAAYANHELPAVPYDADHADRLVVIACRT